MLLVATKLEQSEIHGIGLFTTRFINKGELVWQFRPPFDQRFSSQRELKGAKQVLDHYGYVNPLQPDAVVLCFDDARFMNFAEEPNTGMAGIMTHGEFDLFAMRDIEPGEELTVGLNTDADAQRKLNSTPILSKSMSCTA